MGRDLQRILGKKKVKHDRMTLEAYSVDSSMYKILPKAVVLVDEDEDVKKVLTYAKEKKVPITPRGGGTGASGASLGRGIIVDFTHYDRILDVNPEHKYVVVQPGVVYADLNKALAKHNLFFPPDPASGDMCTIGGMIGHDASGPRSVKYGSTKGYLLELTIILPDGKKLDLKEMDVGSNDFKQLLNHYEQFRRLVELLRQNKDVLKASKPKVKKSVARYNLADLAEALEQGKFPAHLLFAASEGTLGVVTKAKLRLLDKPSRKASVLAFFNKVEEVGYAVTDILELKPSALEIQDANAMDMVGRENYDVPLEAKMMLLIEFDEGNLEKKLEETVELYRKYELSKPIQSTQDTQEQAKLWSLRNALVPSLYSFDVRKKPITFIEDMVVPSKSVPELVIYLDAISKKYKIPVVIYGHIGDGNTHFRPLVDPSDPADLKLMDAIYHEVHLKTLELGGTITGEHGVGRLRGNALKQEVGDQVFKLFLQLKNIFDPAGILNPEVKLALKDFREDIKRELPGDCSTCGKCVTVCPVYYALRCETQSPRARSLLLASKENLPKKQINEVVYRCLNCKRCRTACPAGVDVPKLVLEWREVHPRKGKKPVVWLMNQGRFFEKISKLGGSTQKLWDNPLIRPIVQGVSTPTMKVSRKVKLPKISSTTLRDRHSELTDEIGKKGKVAYYHGCAENLLDNGVGDAVINVLQRNGFSVALPEQRCCGEPAATYGLKKSAVESARFNIDSLLEFDDVVTSCATCYHALKEYPSFFPDDDEYRKKAEKLASKSYDISEFLIRQGKLKLPQQVKMKPVKVAYHDPCHLKVNDVIKQPRELLKKLPNVDFVEIGDASGCCGAGGTYFMANPKISHQIFEKNRKAVEKSGATVVATSCPGCIMQFQNELKDKVKVKHVVQLLDDLYNEA